ncbi:MAG: phosphoribosylglycinamide formyltransferase [Saccharofermentanales bacterium]
MMKIAVFVSGGGTNLQAIIDRIRERKLTGIEIARVIASRDGTRASQRAAAAGIPVEVINRKNYSSLSEYDDALIGSIKEDSVELIVLAGFLSFLGEKFIDTYSGRIINVHPSLIPSFCGTGMYGLKPHIAAIEAGVKISGATVHFVDKEYDAGPIILQKAVQVDDDDTPEDLQQRVMIEAEQILLPQAIQLFCDGAIKIEGHKTRIIK